MIHFGEIFKPFKINEYGNIINPSNLESITCGPFVDDSLTVKPNYLLKNNETLIAKIQNNVLGKSLTEDEMNDILSQAFMIQKVPKKNKYILRSLLHIDRYITATRYTNVITTTSLTTTTTTNPPDSSVNFSIELTYKENATLFTIRNTDFIIKDEPSRSNSLLENNSTLNTYLEKKIMQNDIKGKRYYSKFIDYLKYNNILLGNTYKQNNLDRIDFTHQLNNLLSTESTVNDNPLLMKDMKERINIINDEHVNNQTIIDDLENDKQMNIRDSMLSIHAFNKTETIRFYIKLVAIILAIIVCIYYMYISYTRKSTGLRSVTTISSLMVLSGLLLSILIIILL
tara:strand:+ start:22 stop:1047 length:1026 start_codon:yes stop_codon:yes gene_type:complete